MSITTSPDLPEGEKPQVTGLLAQCVERETEYPGCECQACREAALDGAASGAASGDASGGAGGDLADGAGGGLVQADSSQRGLVGTHGGTKGCPKSASKREIKVESWQLPWYKCCWGHIVHRPGRVFALDLARGIALLMMFAWQLDIGGHKFSWASAGTWGSNLGPLSAALYALVAGASIGLVTQHGTGRGAGQVYRGMTLFQARFRIIIRALLLVVLAALIGIFSSHVTFVLGSFALWYLLAILFLNWRPKKLFIFSAIWALVGPVIHLFYVCAAVTGLGPAPSLTDGVFFTYGLDTIVPFTSYFSFVLVGLGLARLDWRAPKLWPRVFAIGLSLTVVGFGLGAVAAQFVAPPEPLTIGSPATAAMMEKAQRLAEKAGNGGVDKTSSIGSSGEGGGESGGGSGNEAEGGKDSGGSTNCGTPKDQVTSDSGLSGGANCVPGSAGADSSGENPPAPISYLSCRCPADTYQYYPPVPESKKGQDDTWQQPTLAETLSDRAQQFSDLWGQSSSRLLGYYPFGGTTLETTGLMGLVLMLISALFAFAGRLRILAPVAAMGSVALSLFVLQTVWITLLHSLLSPGWDWLWLSIVSMIFACRFLSGFNRGPVEWIFYRLSWAGAKIPRYRTRTAVGKKQQDQTLTVMKTKTAGSAGKRPWYRRLVGENARIYGLDLARGVAVLGMFAVHLGMTQEPVLRDPSTWLGLSTGRASALFALLAGVSVGIMSGGPKTFSGQKLLQVRMRIVARALLLLVWVGMLSVVNSGVVMILGCYGFWFLLIWPLLQVRARNLFIMAAAVAVISPWLRIIYSSLVFSGEGQTPDVTLFNYAFDSTYPITTYFAFVLVGLGLSRLDITRKKVQVWMLVAGVAFATVGHIVTVDLDESGGKPSGEVPQSLQGTWAPLFPVTEGGERIPNSLVSPNWVRDPNAVDGSGGAGAGGGSGVGGGAADGPVNPSQRPAGQYDSPTIVLPNVWARDTLRAGADGAGADGATGAGSAGSAGTAGSGSAGSGSTGSGVLTPEPTQTQTCLCSEDQKKPPAVFGGQWGVFTEPPSDKFVPDNGAGGEEVRELNAWELLWQNLRVSWKGVFVAFPHAANTGEAFQTGGEVMALLALILLLGRLLYILAPVAAVGSMSLTAYSLHVVYITLMPFMFLGLGQSMVMPWAVLVVGMCALAWAWRVWRGRGPLEWVLWKLGHRAARIPKHTP